MIKLKRFVSRAISAKFKKDSPLKSGLSLKDQSGQIAVIVFLIMAVLLVIGLSLAVRTGQQIEQAGLSEDTTRVFNGAESGVEVGLDPSEVTFEYGEDPQQNPDPITINDTEVVVTIEKTTDLSPIVQSGNAITIYTKGGSGQDMSIRWGDKSSSNCSDHASIIISTYIQSGSNYSAQHQAYNPYNLSGCPSNQFSSSSNGGSDYQSLVTFTVPDNAKFVRVRPLYHSAQFGITGSAVDTQAHIIRSQATDVAGGSSEVRTIEVTRTKPAPPSILDYALYSGGDLRKN